MQAKRFRSHNNAITRIASPEQKLPVLIPWDKEGKSGEALQGNVRRLVREDLDLYFKNRRAFEAEYGAVDKLMVPFLRFAFQLADAIAKRNDKDLDRAIDRLFTGLFQAPPTKPFKWGRNALAPTYKEDPIKLLPPIFNGGLSYTRMVVWWNSIANRLATGILCETIGSALFALILFEISDIGAYARCKRKACPEKFFRTLPFQQYCSPNCQAADGMRRKREKHKRERSKLAKSASA